MASTRFLLPFWSHPNSIRSIHVVPIENQPLRPYFYSTPNITWCWVSCFSSAELISVIRNTNINIIRVEQTHMIARHRTHACNVWHIHSCIMIDVWEVWAWVWVWMCYTTIKCVCVWKNSKLGILASRHFSRLFRWTEKERSLQRTMSEKTSRKIASEPCIPG